METTADTKPEAKTETKAESKSAGAVKLPGLFAFKVGMTRVVNDAGEMVTCTVLKYEPWKVSQVKTAPKDGYTSVQIACREKKQKRTPKAQQGTFKKAGFKFGAQFVREFRTDKNDGIAVGSEVSIESLAKGDKVKATSVSKGKGFQGAVKRWNSGGGPAAHGSCFHRQPGSSGNRTWPGRIMKGKAFPGHLGDETVSIKNLKVVDVYKDDNLILVSGPVPGARNALVRLMKLA